MKKLLLFDGNALMHRAYHALPPLTSPQGWLVNAVYGFFSILLSTLPHQKPDYVAVVFDVKGPTFRNKIYKGYKAKRVKPPQSFYDQIPIIKKLLRLMEIPILEQKGYEADDVIGSISLKISKKYPQLKIVIVTSDMDVLQLVTKQVKVLSFPRGVKEGKIWGVKEVKEKLGFGPSRQVDFKALRGDPSDNIPGVSGIGFKIAQELIKEYCTLERVYQNLDKIKPAVRAKLEKDRSTAFLSRELAGIKCNLKITLKLQHARLHDFDKTKVGREFSMLGFNTLIKRLPQSRRKHIKQGKLFG